jgi:N-acetylneuraminate synthase
MLIAEIGSVHDGSFGNAKKLIELAAECGADAVKFQTHIPEYETLKNSPAPEYFNDEPRFDYFKRTSFTLNQWQKLKDVAKKNKVTFLSSPFSLEAIDLLEKIDLEIYKIPSGEVTNLPLLERISKLQKPVLLSSGMSNWNELDNAVKIFKGKVDLTVMQCSSQYPCKNDQVGLNVISEISSRYKCSVGFSDHTIGFAAPIAAAAKGAKIIEKHFTFSKKMYGSDAQHSMEPHEFKILSKSLKEVWEMQDNPVDKNSNLLYVDLKNIFEKSIVTSKSLKAGTTIEMQHLAFKKPGSGISAANYKNIIGKKLLVDCDKDQQIEEEWLQ